VVPALVHAQRPARQGSRPPADSLTAWDRQRIAIARQARAYADSADTTWPRPDSARAAAYFRIRRAFLAAADPPAAFEAMLCETQRLFAVYGDAEAGRLIDVVSRHAFAPEEVLLAETQDRRAGGHTYTGDDRCDDPQQAPVVIDSLLALSRRPASRARPN
jgi:hypothetical protein